MLKHITVAAATCLALASAPALAADPPAAAKPAAAKPATSKAPAKAPAKTPAKPSAGKATAAAGAAAATAAALTPGQLDAAQRVLTGKASCEFDQTVEVAAVEGKPGHFTLKFKTSTYSLVPEETTTGAVRLEDKRAGIVWLQIPSKSMLMNAKLGQRVADNCMMAQQRG